jgi:intein-encoded DNA endonuclease-like protein
MLSHEPRLSLDIFRECYTYVYRKDYRMISKSKLISLYATKTDEEIGQLYGVTGRSVGDWRRKYGIPTKERAPRYTLDASFFETIDTQEKAYALGFLAADGSVEKSGLRVVLSLHDKDEHILHDIRRALASNSPVYQVRRGGFPGSGTRKAVAFHGKKIVSDLAKYGVVNAKSLIIRYPDIPKNMDRHFVRGYFDGNGHIRAIPRKLFCFVGGPPMIEGLQKIIHDRTGLELGIYRVKPTCHRLSGYGGSADVLHWMYKDATIFLNRKHDVYVTHWK